MYGFGVVKFRLKDLVKSYIVTVIEEENTNAKIKHTKWCEITDKNV